MALRLVAWLALAGVMALNGVSPAAAQAIPPDPRFGIVESYINPQAASEAGAGYTRIILRWDVIQPAGRDDWKPANVPDPLIEAELAAGRQVIGLLIGTPAWAVDPALRDETQPASIAVPDMFHWEAFLRRLAQQYRGRIDTWVIWNEPDVWMVGHPGRTWDGSEADYARLLKTAFLAIKAEDPDARVLLAGLTYFWDWEHGRTRYLDRLLAAIAADPKAQANGYYFDAVIYHLYFNPRQAVQVLEETRGTLARFGLGGKPIWINETNAPPSDDPQEPPWAATRFQVSLEEQAAFIWQELALAFANGASRVQVYKLRNTAGHPESIEPFGLLRADNSRRPAFFAYQAATTYLSGFQAVSQQRQGEVMAVTFKRGGRTSSVLWTDGRSPARVRVNAIAAQALLVDELGRASPLAASEGVYVVDLPGATCTQGTTCFIGGAPRILVEAGSPAGRLALTQLATPTPTITEPPPAMPSASATPSPTISSTQPPTPTPRPAQTATPSPSQTPTSAPTATRSPRPTATPQPQPSAEENSAGLPIPPVGLAALGVALLAAGAVTRRKR